MNIYDDKNASVSLCDVQIWLQKTDRDILTVEDGADR